MSFFVFTFFYLYLNTFFFFFFFQAEDGIRDADVTGVQTCLFRSTQLTMRTFHIGGAASRASAVDSVQVKHGGRVRLHNIKFVERADGKLVVVSRSSALAVADDHGREREYYKLPYGAELSVKEGDVVEAGQAVAKWDPHTHPIVAEAEGTVQYAELEEGLTIHRTVDEMTGLSSIEVIEAAARPMAGGRKSVV